MTALRALLERTRHWQRSLARQAEEERKRQEAEDKAAAEEEAKEAAEAASARRRARVAESRSQSRVSTALAAVDIFRSSSGERVALLVLYL